VYALCTHWTRLPIWCIGQFNSGWGEINGGQCNLPALKQVHQVLQCPVKRPHMIAAVPGGRSGNRNMGAEFSPVPKFDDSPPVSTMKSPVSDGIVSAWPATTAKQAIATIRLTLKHEVDAFDIGCSFVSSRWEFHGAVQHHRRQLHTLASVGK